MDPGPSPSTLGDGGRGRRLLPSPPQLQERLQPEPGSVRSGGPTRFLQIPAAAMLNP